ncbi:DUF4291 family protein [Kitasatospora sp. NPDC089913]|uniref:DUF4291 family protein n=1 Tax=Kitasatospora sp. NPDC089913 TaxID=3364080 RepID=UPI0038233E39
MPPPNTPEPTAPEPKRRIRAVHTAATVTVYQAYSPGIGLPAARRYADEWTVSITDLTPLVRRIHGHLRAGEPEAARRLLPEERPYPVAGGLPPHLGG